jgi:hypothetical protein
MGTGQGVKQQRKTPEMAKRKEMEFVYKPKRAAGGQQTKMIAARVDFGVSHSSYG